LRLQLQAPAVKRVAVVFSPDTAPFAPLFWQPVVDAAARSFAVNGTLLRPLTAACGTKLLFTAVQNYVRFLGYIGREMLAVRL
jgi:hypothetical protein